MLLRGLVVLLFGFLLGTLGDEPQKGLCRCNSAKCDPGCWGNTASWLQFCKNTILNTCMYMTVRFSCCTSSTYSVFQYRSVCAYICSRVYINYMLARRTKWFDRDGPSLASPLQIYNVSITYMYYCMLICPPTIGYYNCSNNRKQTPGGCASSF